MGGASSRPEPAEEDGLPCCRLHDRACVYKFCQRPEEDLAEVLGPLQQQLDQASEELWQAQQLLAEERQAREEAMDKLSEVCAAQEAQGQQHEAELKALSQALEEERAAREQALRDLAKDGERNQAGLKLAHQALLEERDARERVFEQLVSLMKEQVLINESKFQVLQEKVDALQAAERERPRPLLQPSQNRFNGNVFRRHGSRSARPPDDTEQKSTRSSPRSPRDADHLSRSSPRSSPRDADETESDWRLSTAEDAKGPFEEPMSFRL